MCEDRGWAHSAGALAAVKDSEGHCMPQLSARCAEAQPLLAGNGGPCRYTCMCACMRLLILVTVNDCKFAVVDLLPGDTT